MRLLKNIIKFLNNIRFRRKTIRFKMNWDEFYTQARKAIHRKEVERVAKIEATLKTPPIENKKHFKELEFLCKPKENFNVKAFSGKILRAYDTKNIYKAIELFSGKIFIVDRFDRVFATPDTIEVEPAYKNGEPAAKPFLHGVSLEEFNKKFEFYGR